MAGDDGGVPVEEAIAQETLGDRAVFVVRDPGRLRVWHTGIEPPIDAARYPILTMRYRADNPLAKVAFYHLWLDDGSGPDHGGVSPFSFLDDAPVGDGKERELRLNLRTAKTPPGGPIVAMALAVSAGRRPVRYELLEPRFSAPGEGASEARP